MTTTESIWAVQIVEEAPTKAEADQIAAGLRTQAGFIGLRLLPPSDSKGPAWRVQAIMEDCGPEAADALPDGMRRVFVPGHMRALFA